jgi:pimeloyl-ACP methyl ester carboxylesterase
VQPALLVVAAGDELDPPPAASELRASYPGVHVESLAGATHFLLEEEHRATSVVCSYLKGVLS